MRKLRFSDNQVLAIMGQAESGVLVANLSREHGRVSGLFCQRRSKYGCMDVPMIKCLKELKAENARLKNVYAEKRIKAEPRQEALEGELSGHPNIIRWP